MAEAKATIPHFQVQTEVEMDAALAFRAELEALAGEGDPVPSLNDLIVKAAALALREHPLANGSYSDDGFVLHDAINVGVAVAADDALIVPTVFDAADKIPRRRSRARPAAWPNVCEPVRSPRRARGRHLHGLEPRDVRDDRDHARDQSAAGGDPRGRRDRETLARVDGEIVDRQLLTLTLSCDHRILYGADAARFLADIRNLLETPLKLAL